MPGLVPGIHVLDVNNQIGIGESLAAPPLPHHRTYGSVYGDSVKLGCMFGCEGCESERRDEEGVG
jgi:hypothetical protein